MEKIYISKGKIMKWTAVALLIAAGIIGWQAGQGSAEGGRSWQEISSAPRYEGEDSQEVWWDSLEEALHGASEKPERQEESSWMMLGVHVTGAVKEPDRILYLPEGSRVGDAVEAAGGPAEDADLSQLNLAGYIQDGQRIYVPHLGEKMTNLENTSAENAETPLTNINLASKIELLALPGIGETYAERIIQYREENGPFESIEDIMNVKGIGASKFDDFKDKITVE